jgi:hypothetical protein
MRSVLLALPLGLFASFAAAEVATPEGAADLTRVFQTYLGATAGVVTVAPLGGVYDVKIDFAPLIAKADASAETKITPIEFSLTDNGNGIWAMTQDQAFDARLSIPGQADIAFSIANLSGSGTFDENLGAFSNSSTQMKDLKVVETIKDPNAGETHVDYTVASLRYETSGKPAATSGADITSTYAMQGLSETFTLPGMGLPLKLSAASATGSAQIDAMRPDAIYKLIAFFVANPEEAAITAQQSTLKAILRDGMPIFDHLSATSTTSSLAVQSPVGLFGASEASVSVEANGLTDTGLLREAISVKGLKIPAGLAPDWATDLITDSVSLDVKLTNFNPAAGLRILLDSIDLADPQKQPDELALMQAFMPDGEVEVTLNPSNMTSNIAALSAEGSLRFGPEVMPSGKGRVTMTGMTATRQALTKAPPEVGMQMAPALGMAEGMAKSGENGALYWDLELTRDGKVLVNGADMSALGGN